jgi:hypothetical protein
MILEQHTLSAAFPSMGDIEFDALSKSIAKVGLLNPIVLFEGKVIDGWHRYLACTDEGIELKTINLADDIDPQEYVIAQNKERRHLTQSQLATAAIKVYEWHSEGNNNLPNSAQYAELADDNKINDLGNVKTSAQIAEIAGVSTRTIEQAKQVETKATPEIKAKVQSGEISVSTAVNQMANKPKDSADKYSLLQETISNLQEALNELTKNLEDAIAENETLLKAFEADDKLTEALAEAKKYRELFAIERRMKEGEVNAKNEYIKKVKSLERQLAKVQRV